MITTITTEAVATITAGQTTAIGMVAAATLLLLLINRELLASSAYAHSQSLSKSLLIAIVPLAVGFLMLAVIKLGGLL